MASVEWRIQMPRRRAVARIYPEQAKRLGVGDEAGDYECFVLATLPDFDENNIIPVFVCEFLNGCVGNVYTERVSFIDTDDNGNIIKE